jgi:hypothetical protein
VFAVSLADEARHSARFDGCQSLVEVNLPEGATETWSLAFCYRTALVTVMIPQSRTKAGNQAHAAARR